MKEEGTRAEGRWKDYESGNPGDGGKRDEAAAARDGALMARPLQYRIARALYPCNTT